MKFGLFSIQTYTGNKIVSDKAALMLSSIYCLTYPNKLGDQTLSILVSWFAFSQCRFWYWLATVGWAEFSMCQIFVLASCISGKKWQLQVVESKHHLSDTWVWSEGIHLIVLLMYRKFRSPSSGWTFIVSPTLEFSPKAYNQGPLCSMYLTLVFKG